MVEKNRKNSKKENIPEHNQIPTRDEEDVNYQRYPETPSREYRQGGYQYVSFPGYTYNESFPNQQYRYNMSKFHDEYEQGEDVDKETSSDEEKKIKKTGRKKISMEYIEGKNKRSVTFSKRKKGIMKKAYELNVLTGTQILLLVASESGHVYTFATPKLKPIISNHERLIQQCLNTPTSPEERVKQPFKYSKEEDKKDKYYQGYGDYYGNYDNRE